jgi:multicomponent Na+:H+ antiporter subunit A
MTLVILTLLSFVFPFLIHPVYSVAGKKTGWITALYPLTIFICGFFYLPGIQDGNRLLVTLPWIPSVGANLSFSIDGLSLLFVLLISGIGTLIFIYAGAYLKDHPLFKRFFMILSLFMGSMLGLVLSHNILVLFVFWELTSITSYLLIGFDHEDSAARSAALKALLLTGLGGLSLLAGLILLGMGTGSYEFTAMQSMSGASSLYLPILLLILVGVFTKSAQVPFHFWLPAAMKAPAPVSAYLHSATMVNAGVFLLMRLNPVLGGTPQWHFLVTLAGVATMVVASLIALPQKDLKSLLAYTTLIALGILVMLMGLDTNLAVKAALVFLVVHSLYKGALFMISGIVDHETGTREITGLRSLLWAMPISATASALAAFSMSGFPPLLGFVGKELLYEAKVQAPSVAPVIIAAGILANAVNVAVAVLAGFKPFWGKKSKLSHRVHEVSVAFWLGPLIMSLAGLFLGFFANNLGRVLISPALTVIRAEFTMVQLKMWHGISEILLLSIFTVVLGIGLLFFYKLFRRIAFRISSLRNLSLTSIFERTLVAFQKFSLIITRIFQNGYVRFYLITILLAFIILLIPSLSLLSKLYLHVSVARPLFYEVGLAVLMLLALILVISTPSRLAAITALGIIGYGIAIIYAFHGAPDLALTQLLVETLTVILFALVIYRLPRFTRFSTTSSRWRDGIIALLSGGFITILILKAGALQFHPSISDFYLRESYPAAHGKNVVNVILVDFRALDTLGEISVLAVAAVGVWALLKLKTGKN